MNRNEREALRWWKQACYDLEMANANYQQGFYALVCFLCHQSAEKALKAYLYYQGEGPVIGHSTYILAKRCAKFEDDFEILLPTCRQLDQYYTPTRYPNALPGGIPHEFFTDSEASPALESLRQLISFVEEKLSF
jgi:HEPN domain-containing protein